MRIVHFLVVGMLVFAAAYVYRIKMESTSRVERVQRLNAEIREQRDAIAVLRAEWARLDAPLRLQGLSDRHRALNPITAQQYALLKNLPEPPPSFTREPDPIGSDSNSPRRTTSLDAIATARPDIVDRNGEILATDVKAPSLFAEPRRIIDKDEAIELLTGVLPDLDTIETRERLATRKGFVWL